MKLTRLVLSDLHLANGHKVGEPNPLEDFFHDERFAELLEHYDREHGQRGGVEIILNGDICDLRKIKIDGEWRLEASDTHAGVAQIVAFAETQGVRIDQIRAAGATLEDAFITILEQNSRRQGADA